MIGCPSGYGFVSSEGAISFNGSSSNILQTNLQVPAGNMTLFLDAWASNVAASNRGMILSLMYPSSLPVPAGGTTDEILIENDIATDPDRVYCGVFGRYASSTYFNNSFTFPGRFTIAITISEQNGTYGSFDGSALTLISSAIKNNTFDYYSRLQLGVRVAYAYSICKIYTAAFFPRVLTSDELTLLRSSSLAGFTGVKALASGTSDNRADIYLV